tara:strand:+ start:755 stop:1015 length:261 start_codon:yes stop_codon:yes gene_type:complete
METNKDYESIIKLTFAVDSLTETMKEFKEDFKQFRAIDIKAIHSDIQGLKDREMKQIGVINFLKTTWYFVGAIIVSFLIYIFGWRR